MIDAAGEVIGIGSALNTSAANGEGSFIGAEGGGAGEGGRGTCAVPGAIGIGSRSLPGVTGGRSISRTILPNSSRV